jgi:cytochrome c oxidase subunit 2
MFSGRFLALCDAAEPWQLGTQDPATPALEGMVSFHYYLIVFLVAIGSFVMWLLYQVLVTFDKEVHRKADKFTHSSKLEIVWTIVPALVLILIAIPSFSLLYSTEELIQHSPLTLKVIGHQWYWSYEYSDMTLLRNGYDVTPIEFESYMIATEDLKSGTFRLLEVDNRVCLPINMHIRVLVTAADVLHCWAIPSFGFKIDACPGRLSQGSLFIKREGVFYGQCSEICGVNHGFMPIVVEAVNDQDFITWMATKIVQWVSVNPYIVAD